MPFTPFTWMAFGVYHDKWISGIYHVDRKILIVVRGVVISDKSSDDIIGEGRGGQKQVFFFLKGAWTGRNSPSRSSWGVLVFILLLGFRNSFRQRRGLFTLFRIKFHHFSVSDRTITRCLGKFSFVFPSASSAVVSCFCTKLSGICTKQNIFCTKTGENSGMFFQHFRDLFMRIADFFAFFSWLFRWKNPFFFKSDRPSMTEFIPIDRISFMLFSDDSINFSASFPVDFCIFPSAYEKSAAFSIRIIRFLRFFRFVGIIFLAFSRAELRNFSSHSRIFYASPEFFQKKNPLFSLSIT